MGTPMRYALAVVSFLACWSGGAFGAEMLDEYWRCGPYRITIIPGPDYSREGNNQFEDYIVIKNGKRLHVPNRMRILYHRRRCPICLVGGDSLE